jgi:colanic acid/amylovoran biosynthesis glycosyltransferase
VFSSFGEGVPVVLIEAMALGVPCIAPRITGITELIRDGVEGILVTPANVEELAGAIVEMMDEPDLRRRMASASRARVAEKYDLRKNAARLSGGFKRNVPLKNGQPPG